MTYLGIDPAFRKTGFAAVIINGAGEVAAYQFTGFLDFMQWVDGREWPNSLVVCIENSNLQNTSFDISGTKGVVARKGRNVGANQAASQYTVDYCCYKFGANRVLEVSPKKKGKKWNQKEFQAVVKQEGHTLCGERWNQDKRDAYKLALIGKQNNYKLKIK